MESFSARVLKIVQTIPSGKVMSYGQIALYLGEPKATREVGWAMHALGETTSENFPWWRVLGNTGKITIPEKADATPHMQQELLAQEGVRFDEPFVLDMNTYRHKAERSKLEELGLGPLIIESALEKYGEGGGTQGLGI